MIKVIVERQLKSGQDIGRLLFDLHMKAVQQKGHISYETLINPNDNRTIVVISNWESLEDWKTWECSKKRAELASKIEPLLAKKELIKIYDVISPMDIGLYADPAGWTQEHEHPHFDG